jgi:hypothetical protein
MGEENESEVKEFLGGESTIIHDLGKGLVAGLVGTVAAALLLVLQGVFGIVPEFDFIGMLTKASGVSGWIVFFAGGILLGLAFAILDARVETHPGTDEPIRGAFFGFLIWLLLMVGFMPFYGGGAFAMAFGIGAPILMFAVNVVHGLVTGLAYGKMNPENISDE